MNEDLIYDTSLLCHATLTNLVQKGNLWKGPLCYKDIMKTFRLLYTYVTREQNGSLNERCVLQFRYKSDYSDEENIWGSVETYKRLLGLIVFNQCEIKADLRLALERFASTLTNFKSTLVSGLLVIILHNESNDKLRFNDLVKVHKVMVNQLKDSIYELPAYSEVVVLPGNGFQDEQCCMQVCVNSSSGGMYQRYYRFNSLLDNILRDTLLREAQSLRLSIVTYLKGHFKQSRSPPSPPTILVPSHKGKCLSFSGQRSVPVVSVCIGEVMKPLEHSGDLSEPFGYALQWTSEHSSPLTVISAQSSAEKALESQSDKSQSKFGPIVYEAFAWGLRETTPAESRQRLCRMNKLTGDLFVQLGEFEVGQWYYRNAIRYSSHSDPAVWQSALLTGFAAALYLKEVDIFGWRRFIDPCCLRRSAKKPSGLLSPVLDTTDYITGLDLAVTRKLDSKLPRSAAHALFRANQSIQSLRKASLIPRCMIEVMYKNADHLVTLPKRSSAIRVLTSLQTDLIPQGDAFIFERLYVLANLCVRLGLRHKAGLLHYLLENSLFSAIPLPHTRPPPLLTRASESCYAFINRFSSSYLGSSYLTEAYQLRISPSGFRRASDNPIGVVFVCSLVSPTVDYETAAASSSPGWPVLQRQLLVSIISRIRTAVEQSTSNISEANWEQCIGLLSYMFSLVNGWHRGLPASDLPNYIEILQSLAKAMPVDQPPLPQDVSRELLFSRHHHGEVLESSAVRYSFGKPLSSTLHPLSELVELHIDKVPIVRSLSIRRLPPHSLPSRMSYEALSSMVAIEETMPDYPAPYNRRKTLLRQPTFITNPFQLSSSDTADWVGNDLGYIDVVFDNPFAIPLELNNVCFELIEDTDDSSARTITLKSVQIISAPGTLEDEIILKPFSECLFEQVPFYLAHGILPGTKGYTEKVILAPDSTRSRFVFALTVPCNLSEIGTDRWRVCAISYALPTFGGFRVCRPLNGCRSSGWTLYPSPQDALNSAEECGVKAQVSMAQMALPPPIRMCFPLPRLCLLVGACTHERVDRVKQPPRGSILDSLATAAPSFSPCLRLASALNNQETKQNVCNIIVDLHPYETRWLPIQLFVGKNACSLPETLKMGQQLRRYEGESYLNILHISLQTTLSANKFLQKYNLLLGQFLQIPNVLDVRQKLPLKLTPMDATKHCRLKHCKTDDCCGTLWLKVDSGAFWDAWLHDTSATQCPGPQSLVAQLCIEFAADVAPATTQEENLSRTVIGRCVKVGIEIRFLTSLDAPIRILSPQIRHEALASDKSPADCTFQFKLESVLSPELKNVIQPSLDCRFYRIEVDVEFFWYKSNCLFRNNLKALPLATQWTPFVVNEVAGIECKGASMEKMVAGLIPSEAPEVGQGHSLMGLPLSRLLQIFQQAAFPPLAVATRPTDELLLPLPLPHSLGRLLECWIEIRWTARMVLNVSTSGGPDASPSVRNHFLPNLRSGRIVPLSPVLSSESPTPPWYFPLLKNPYFVAKILWKNRIWLQLVQRFQYDVPVYTAQECPVCRTTAADSKGPASSLRRNTPTVDAMATHVAVLLPAKMPLELYGGIEGDEFFNHLHDILTKQFSPFVDASRRVCVDLSETKADFVTEAALMAMLQDGIVLHRLWIGLNVFEASESGKYLTTSRPLAEGSGFCLDGCLRGQMGLRLGKRASIENDGVSNSPYGNASVQSLRGSVVFTKTGNYFVRGFVHLLPLPFTDAETPPPGLRVPPAHTFFAPIQETPHSFLFHPSGCEDPSICSPPTHLHAMRIW
uniref:Trafficking protein particle complex subunit 9 n=1 Tax=Echinococcus granulosus TaxID=6210 RepID=A0A068WAB8_ECHGR|nr:hypothetical protein EgrG_000972700 [Echinococcus granulosus]